MASVSVSEDVTGKQPNTDQAANGREQTKTSNEIATNLSNSGKTRDQHQVSESQTANVEVMEDEMVHRRHFKHFYPLLCTDCSEPLLFRVDFRKLSVETQIRVGKLAKALPYTGYPITGTFEDDNSKYARHVLATALIQSFPRDSCMSPWCAESPNHPRITQSIATRYATTEYAALANALLLHR